MKSWLFEYSERKRRQVSRTTYDDHRLKVIEELVTLSAPLRQTKRRLLQFPYDCKGNPYVLTVHDVRHAIRMFECGRVSAAELTEWARLIERRDDIDAEDFGNGTRDWVLSAIFLLSNPELVGDSIPALIEAILNEYKRVLQ